MTDGQDWPVEDITPKFNKPAIPKDTAEAKIAKLETAVERLTAALNAYRRDHREDNWCHDDDRCALCIKADAALTDEAHG